MYDERANAHIRQWENSIFAVVYESKGSEERPSIALVKFDWMSETGVKAFLLELNDKLLFNISHSFYRTNRNNNIFNTSQNVVVMCWLHGMP